jgi:hypothetical protein
LAYAYKDGRGVDEDRSEAVRLYTFAAVRGESEAQVQLAVMLESGDGVEVDRVAATRWAIKAAAQGHPDGLTTMCILFDQLFPVGSTVALVGLKAKTLNGQRGTIADPTDAATKKPAVGRLAVVLAGSNAGQSKAIKFENLVLIQAVVGEDLGNVEEEPKVVEVHESNDSGNGGGGVGGDRDGGGEEDVDVLEVHAAADDAPVGSVRSTENVMASKVVVSGVAGTPAVAGEVDVTSAYPSFPESIWGSVDEFPMGMDAQGLEGVGGGAVAEIAALVRDGVQLCGDVGDESGASSTEYLTEDDDDRLSDFGDD